MTQTLIPTNLPVFFQCLRFPVKWAWLKLSDGLGYVAPHVDRAQYATTFDPWEKRSEFLRLRPGNTDKLLTFLNSVGVFGLHKHIDSKVSAVRTTDGEQYATRYE